MNYQREIAGIFAGIAGLILLCMAVMMIEKDSTIAMALIAIGMAPFEVMLAFFIGEKNGERKTKTS